MNWVNVDWADAKCLKEISFDVSGSPRWEPPVGEDQLDVFSDVIEAFGRCLVCRASGPAVDVFDISPTAESLVSWRVLLPSPVVPDIGIAYVQDPGGSSLTLMFLTKAHVIHSLRVALHHSTPDLFADGSTACALPSPPSSFCALDRGLVAVGCFNGTLHAVSIGQGHAAYEFTDASFVQRLVSGLLHPAQPQVLALAAMGRSEGTVLASGFLLLSFSADGKLRLWEALQHRGVLLASKVVLPSSQEHAASLLGTSSVYMRVSRSRTRACLVLRDTVLVIDLPAAGSAGTFAVREIEPPFPAAAPSLVALSHDTLWSFWSGQTREQLFHLNLEEHDSLTWQSKALEAALFDVEAAPGSEAMRRVAAEGADGGAPDSASQRTVFTLQQQQEAWRAEEDGFDACQVAEVFEAMKRRPPGQAEKAESEFTEPFDKDLSVEDAVLKWWLGRVFLPGRFPNSVIALAVQEAGGRLPHEPGSPQGSSSTGALRKAVEEHLRGQAAVLCGQGEDLAMTSHLQVVAALGSAAGELLRICNAVWRRKHQVCGMSASSVWGPHSWHPAGSITAEAYLFGVTDTCALLLCHGGVSCVRPVHSWAERWWATLHLSRDVSSHESIQLGNVLELSSLDEWKLCTTAWFLSQCVGNAGLSMALSLLRVGALPSWPMRRLAGDVPQHLAAHLAQCARCLTNPTISTELATLQELVRLGCCPPERSALVAGEVLDPTSGVWSAAKSAFAQPSPRQPSKVCLSDVLRGSIAVGECEYLCAAMRDLLLLCLYTAQGGLAHGATGSEWPMQVENSAWSDFARVLDEQLPVFLSLHNSMQLALPGPEAVSSGAMRARGCDLWAAAFRTPAGADALGLRPPAASFKSFHYGMQLLRFEGWDAMRWWSKHQHLKEFSAYVAGRQWLAAGRLDPAREAFAHAEGVAGIVVECLRTAGLQVPPPDLCPDIVCYYTHVAELFSSAKGPAHDQHVFLKKAAHLAEEASQSGDADRSACQRLWSATFEKAVGLEKWDEARDALLRIDAFESSLRLLGQRLRDAGKIELMLQLPERHREVFMSSLYEQALLSAPTLGSDSLACYQCLYALHFSSQEYLEAASVAHALCSALGTPPHGLMGQEEAGDATCGATAPMLALAGGCGSAPQDVLCNPGPGAGPMDLEPAEGALAAAGHGAWPLLEQRRNALLMLSTALSLTEERLLLLPGAAGPVPFNASSRAAGAHGPAAFGAGPSAAGVVAAASGPGAGLDLSASELEDFRQWFAEAEERAAQAVFTLDDAEKLLAVTEADMILSGRAGSLAPPKVAQSVASLGLLGLALRITEACKLDHWRFALQPFLRLCLESDRSDDGRLGALVDAARGPAMAFMFAQSDGCEPLGVGGSTRQGLWRMLDESLRAVCGPQPGERFLNTEGSEMYSQVAHEIFSSQAAPEKLPDFITEALSSGPSWVCLLRLYVKHSRLEDAVELLHEQLKACKPTQEPFEWSPLQAFPAQLVVQLQRCLRQRAEREPSADAARAVESLDEVLAQFKVALDDLERNLEMR